MLKGWYGPWYGPRLAKGLWPKERLRSKLAANYFSSMRDDRSLPGKRKLIKEKIRVRRILPPKTHKKKPRPKRNIKRVKREHSFRIHISNAFTTNRPSRGNRHINNSLGRKLQISEKQCCRKKFGKALVSSNHVHKLQGVTVKKGQFSTGPGEGEFCNKQRGLGYIQALQTEMADNQITSNLLHTVTVKTGGMKQQKASRLVNTSTVEVEFSPLTCTWEETQEKQPFTLKTCVGHRTMDQAMADEEEGGAAMYMSFNSSQNHMESTCEARHEIFSKCEGGRKTQTFEGVHDIKNSNIRKVTKQLGAEMFMEWEEARKDEKLETLPNLMSAEKTAVVMRNKKVEKFEMVELDVLSKGVENFAFGSLAQFHQRNSKILVNVMVTMNNTKLLEMENVLKQIKEKDEQIQRLLNLLSNKDDHMRKLNNRLDSATDLEENVKEFFGVNVDFHQKKVVELTKTITELMSKLEVSEAKRMEKLSEEADSSKIRQMVTSLPTIKEDFQSKKEQVWAVVQGLDSGVDVVGAGGDDKGKETVSCTVRLLYNMVDKMVRLMVKTNENQKMIKVLHDLPTVWFVRSEVAAGGAEYGEGEKRSMEIVKSRERVDSRDKRIRSPDSSLEPAVTSMPHQIVHDVEEMKWGLNMALIGDQYGHCKSFNNVEDIDNIVTQMEKKVNLSVMGKEGETFSRKYDEKRECLISAVSTIMGISFLARTNPNAKGTQSPTTGWMVEIVCDVLKIVALVNCRVEPGDRQAMESHIKTSLLVTANTTPGVSLSNLPSNNENQELTAAAADEVHQHIGQTWPTPYRQVHDLEKDTHKTLKGIEVCGVTSGSMYEALRFCNMVSTMDQFQIELKFNESTDHLAAKPLLALTVELAAINHALLMLEMPSALVVQLKMLRYAIMRAFMDNFQLQMVAKRKSGWNSVIKGSLKGGIGMTGGSDDENSGEHYGYANLDSESDYSEKSVQIADLSSDTSNFCGEEIKVLESVFDKPLPSVIYQGLESQLLLLI